MATEQQLQEDDFVIVMDDFPNTKSAPNEQETEDHKDEDIEDDLEVDEVDDEVEELDDETSEYIKNHFNFLKEKGYINVPEDYDFDGDIYKVYQEDFKRREDAVIDRVLQSIPENVQPILEYAMNGGSDLDKIIALSKQEDDISSLDIESEEGAEVYTKNYLVNNKGLTEKYANAIIETMKNEGSLEEQAQEFYQKELESLSEQRKQMAEQAKQEAQQRKQAQEEYLNSLSQYIESQELEASSKEYLKHEIYGNATVEKLQHILVNDPGAMVEIAKFLFAYDPEEGFKDKTDRKQQTKAAKEMKDDYFSKIASKQSKSSQGQSRRKKKYQSFEGGFEIEPIN